MKNLFLIILGILLLPLVIHTKNFKFSKTHDPKKDPLLCQMIAMVEKIKANAFEDKILPARTRLDHIKLIGRNRTIYLQLENSYIMFRSFSYDPKRLRQQLNDLRHIKPLLNENTKIAIYASRKYRKHFLLKSFYSYDDMYSAAIYIDTDI